MTRRPGLARSKPTSGQRGSGCCATAHAVSAVATTPATPTGPNTSARTSLRRDHGIAENDAFATGLPSAHGSITSAAHSTPESEIGVGAVDDRNRTVRPHPGSRRERLHVADPHARPRRPIARIIRAGGGSSAATSNRTLPRQSRDLPPDRVRPHAPGRWIIVGGNRVNGDAWRTPPHRRSYA